MKRLILLCLVGAFISSGRAEAASACKTFSNTSTSQALVIRRAARAGLSVQITQMTGSNLGAYTTQNSNDGVSYVAGTPVTLAGFTTDTTSISEYVRVVATALPTAGSTTKVCVSAPTPD